MTRHTYFLSQQLILMQGLQFVESSQKFTPLLPNKTGLEVTFCNIFVTSAEVSFRKMLFINVVYKIVGKFKANFQMA